ncbi:hypothetical protein Salat_1112700 [Sesamum alatum]|uniref:Uncharacterized protein n=1 Tax=Sesamum alatum TaxID=300844 RepID=A0AAE2CTF3_9LAMI|nr:hypothetical protein Salat_1112700 [Sesamum alatum]
MEDGTSRENAENKADSRACQPVTFAAARLQQCYGLAAARLGHGQQPVTCSKAAALLQPWSCKTRPCKDESCITGFFKKPVTQVSIQGELNEPLHQTLLPIFLPTL